MGAPTPPPLFDNPEAINAHWTHLFVILLREALTANHPNTMKSPPMNVAPDLTTTQVTEWITWASNRVNEEETLTSGGERTNAIAAMLREAAEDLESGRVFNPPPGAASESAEKLQYGRTGSGPRRIRPMIPGS